MLPYESNLLCYPFLIVKRIPDSTIATVGAGSGRLRRSRRKAGQAVDSRMCIFEYTSAFILKGCSKMRDNFVARGGRSFILSGLAFFACSYLKKPLPR
jgi:hypothetical protein